MNNSKKGIVIIALLSMILIAILGAGIMKTKKLNAVNQKEFNEFMQAFNNETSEQDSKAVDFSGKLKEKQTINMLVLGDGLAASQGKTTDKGSWTNSVVEFIKTTYGSEVKLEVLAQSKAKIEDGLNTVSLNDISGKDLIVVCYGNSDSNDKTSLDTFKANYKSMLTKIKSENPNAGIIVMLPNTLDLDNKYRLAMMEVCNSNEISYADIKTSFSQSGQAESKLVSNSLPTDLGYQVYSQTVNNIISSLAR